MAERMSSVCGVVRDTISYASRKCDSAVVGVLVHTVSTTLFIASQCTLIWTQRSTANMRAHMHLTRGVVKFIPMATHMHTSACWDYSKHGTCMVVLSPVTACDALKLKSHTIKLITTYMHGVAR